MTKYKYLVTNYPTLRWWVLPHNVKMSKPFLSLCLRLSFRGGSWDWEYLGFASPEVNHAISRKDSDTRGNTVNCFFFLKKKKEVTAFFNAQKIAFPKHVPSLLLLLCVQMGGRQSFLGAGDRRRQSQVTHQRPQYFVYVHDFNRIEHLILRLEKKA